MIKQRAFIVVIILLITGAVTYLHYSTSLKAHALHSIYAGLYYIPILLGSLGGLRGALLTYLFVSVLYLPFVVVSWLGTSIFLVDKLLHLVFTGIFALLAGLLVERGRRHQKQLEEDKRELEKLERLKSSFLANVSHELRTPMTAITGYTDLLLDGIDGPVNDEQEKNLRKIASHSQRLLQLINDILDIAKFESGEIIKLRPQEIHLKESIESLMPVFEPLMTQKGLALSLDIGSAPDTVYADADRVRQILVHLLSNALKFTQKGGILVSARTSVPALKIREQPSFVKICIQDTGVGIKEEDLDRIFDRFTQADPHENRQYEGTGIGLSLVKGLVELHGGSVKVTSKYGEGSTFCFTLPIRKDFFPEKE
jgi:signal transduction histidine kinase